MIERIFKNWKTSLVGVLLIVVPLIMVFTKVASLTEVGVFVLGAIPLFFTRDPKKKCPER